MFLQVLWNYIWAFQMQKGKRNAQAFSKVLTFVKGKDLSDILCLCVCVCFALTVVRIEINMYWVNPEPDFIFSLRM